MDEAAILDALRQVDDPELGINVVDLGLVYGVRFEDRAVFVTMTMTSPGCPLGDEITREARERIEERFPGAGAVTVELVWDPPWDQTRLSPDAKKRLGW